MARLFARWLVCFLSGRSRLLGSRRDTWTRVLTQKSVENGLRMHSISQLSDRCKVHARVHVFRHTIRPLLFVGIMRPVYCSAAPADLYRSLALALTVPWRVCLLRPQRTLVEVCCLRSRRCKWTHVQTPSHLVENTFDLAECPALLSSCTRACRTCVSTSTLCGCVVPLPTQIKIAASHSHRLYCGCFHGVFVCSA